ncbi:putative transmembrane protein, partial [Rhizoctonia solani 123E]
MLTLREVCRRISRGLRWQRPPKEYNHDHTSLDSCLCPHRSLRTWVVVAWPLILHCALASAIVAIILRLVDGQDFNLENRRPSVLLPDGSSNPTRFMLLQSDVTTLLSTALAVLRLVAACWLGPLCWRCAFILLKTVGLTQFQLHTTIRYGVPLIPTRGLKTICLVVLLVMAVVLPTNVIAPVLTGSVTWSTSSRLTERVLNSTVSVSTVATNSGWTGWNRYPAARERLAVSAAGYANIAWARYTPGGWSKRVLRSCSVLGINSTVAAVRIPYFSVDSIEWVKDPEHSLSASQLDVL